MVSELFFQAMSSPVRREIVKLLRWKNMNAGEIASHFDIAQPSVSRHLDVLKKAEIVTTERKGTQIMYSLNLTAVQEIVLYLRELLEPREEEAYGAAQIQGVD